MLNISKKIYVGWHANAIFTDVPEADITPIGTSSGEKRKIANFSARHTVLHEYDNEPLPGFTLLDINRRSYSTPDHSCLIIDPRGFKIRISIENLLEILKVTGITEGLVQQKCVWAREDARTTMTLIPVSANNFVEAVANTTLIEDKIAITDVNIGDEVLLQNKKTGIFRGVLSLYCTVRTSVNNSAKPQVYVRRQIIDLGNNRFYHCTDAKILKVITPASKVTTREESAAELNAKILDGTAFFTPYEYMPAVYHNSDGRVRFVSVNSVAKPKIKLEEIDKATATILLTEATQWTDSGVIVTEESNGTQHLIEFPYFSGVGPRNIDEFETRKIDSFDDDSITLVPQDRRSFYSVLNHVKTTYTLDKFAKFYKIVKCVKTDTYI